jgi:hypothetical protein
MKLERIEPTFADLIPKQLTDGVLYVSNRYRTAAHLCCCGCGTKIVTPLKPGFWSLRESKGNVSLWPSVGNWNHPCQSHYVIENNEVQWVGSMSRSAIQQGRRRDKLWLQHNYKSEPPVPTRPPAMPSSPAPTSTSRSWLQRFADRIRSIFR